MRRNNLIIVFVCFLWILNVQGQTNVLLPIIPKPQVIELQQGNFCLTPQTKIVLTNGTLISDVQFFNDYLKQYYGFQLEIVYQKPQTGDVIFFETEESLEPSVKSFTKERYYLSIYKHHIRIIADKGGAGYFYAFQTLIQLLPTQKSDTLNLPCVNIYDSPRFAWRGMHLDVCRHFFDVNFVKRYIDLLALYKINTFHWHLTEDQGWRIEIKKHPKLTQTGAWRKGTMVGKYSDHKYDTIPYGGFYTQDEIKEVVTYAAKRHVTIVPEIEMPGHSVAAISAYPWLSCTGKQIDVERGWGVFEDIYCTKDSVFNFLQDVIDEVVALFPGKYIHIGGDEAPKTRWKTCKTCQANIKNHHLKDEHELQSYFITRMEKYINSKGKQIIGWDEILEGGLAPNAAVMSWRGIEGGVAAAKQKHFVVMSPGSHCYFDHYQASPGDEPLAIGGYTPLEKVYSYEPIPEGLNEDEQQYILGAQANVWTEYILNNKHAEYIAMPRMCALAEVVWTNKNQKNETDFLTRLQQHFLLLDKWNVNYAKALYKVEQRLFKDSADNLLKVELNANPILGEIRYRCSLNAKDFSAYSKYEKPVTVTQNITIDAVLCKDNKPLGKNAIRVYQTNKATGKKITLKTPPSNSYKGEGGFTLVNSVVATLPRINEQWLAWQGNDMEAVIDLGKTEDIKSIKSGYLKEELSWIYLPLETEYYVSADGKTYTLLGKVNKFINDRIASLEFNPIKARYVKIVAKNFGEIPGGAQGAGSKAWLFCDEISID